VALSSQIGPARVRDLHHDLAHVRLISQMGIGLGNFVKAENGKNPLQDARVRQAMSLAIDRDAIVMRLAPFGISVGETVERYGAEGTGPSVYFHDPEGNQIELKGPSL